MTYSIVARDPRTGQLGIAVQSHYFSVGSSVPWAEAEVGAVATQAVVKIDYGPEGVNLMRGGFTAREALDQLLQQDAEREMRQVAMVDAEGNVAAHTGSLCVPARGHLIGEGFSVQGNLLANEGVWPAMKRAFESTPGELADRLVAALEAAQAAGGDVRGQQSAALLVVSGERQTDPWNARLYDLRVEDHQRPVEELKRLLGVRKAYLLTDRGDELVKDGRFEEAMGAYNDAWSLVPDLVELRFWPAVSLFSAGRDKEALQLFGEVFTLEPFWADVIPTLAARGMIPSDAESVARIVARRR